MPRAPLVIAGVLVALAVAASPALGAVAGTNGEIAFTRDYRIWLMQPDGSDARQFSTELATGAKFAPDGRRLAYKSDAGIRIVGLDGQVHSTLQIEGAVRVAWSPAGSELVYEAEGFCDIGDSPCDPDFLGLVATDGARDRELASIGMFPAWSPDGRRIAFGFAPRRCLGIRTVQPSGKDAATLVPARRDRAGKCIDSGVPDYSPHGRYVAFQRGRLPFQFGGTESDSDIFVIDRKMRRLRRLTRVGDAGSPSWSPDGRWIVFDRNIRIVRGRRVRYRQDVWVIRARGGEPRLIARDAEEPSWGVAAP